MEKKKLPNEESVENMRRSNGNKGIAIKNDLDILLLGKTGNGKSSVGNTILGKNIFKSDDAYGSVTTRVEHGNCEFNKRVIKVVDAPGILDTVYKNDIEKATKDVIEKMQDAVVSHTQGYHAFLFVLRYGTRFTREDETVITILKNIFGEDIVKNYCILVLTHGDLFRSNNIGKKFKIWCSEQTGVFSELYKECGNRAVLFDNQTKDENFIQKQIKKLIKMIDNLQSHGRRYCDDLFKDAVKGREKMLLECKESKITEVTWDKCSEYISRIKSLTTHKIEKQLQELQEMSMSVEEWRKNAEGQDNGHGVLKLTLELISQLQSTINTSIKTAQMTVEKNEIEQEKLLLTQRFNDKKEHLKKKKKLTSSEKEILSAELFQFQELIEKYECNIANKEKEIMSDEKMKEDIQKQMKDQYERNLQEINKEIEQLRKQLKEEQSRINNLSFSEKEPYVCNPQ